MSGKHISHDEFLTKLTALFETRRNKEHGSVFMTQKRITPNETSEHPLADLDIPAEPFSIIVRAHDGTSKASKNHPDKTERKIKFSTIVALQDMDTFFTRYADVCKTGMSGLKKRDRKKAKAKKGKGGKAAAPAT